MGNQAKTIQVERTLVSILIPACNEEKRIAECLTTLMNQSYSPIEIIVIDDGSTDKTAEIARTFESVKILEAKHAGKAAAVWAGAQISKGHILFILDADLTFAKDYVESMVIPILKKEAIGTSHGTERVANSSNYWARCFQINANLPVSERIRLTREDKKQGSTIYRAILKDAFMKVGGYDHTGFSDDQTLYPKLKETAKWVEQATCYHYNPDSARETFQSGAWCGRTTALEFGKKSLLSSFPALTYTKSIQHALKKRAAILIPYLMVYYTGVYWGICSYFFFGKKTPGKK